MDTTSSEHRARGRVTGSSGSSSSNSLCGRDDIYTNKHLFVLIHGFFGNPSHLAAMEKTLRRKFPEKDSDIDILLPKGNTGLRSFDGIRLGGERIVEEIALHLIDQGRENKVRYDRISVVGYSLGGLYSRYVVGLLNSRGFFETVRPVMFATFACPHLGSMFHGEGIGKQALNFLGSNFLGISGNDMFGFNSRLLDDMCDPELTFYQGLQKFEHLILFANAVHDRTVPFFTSYICDKDPFQHRDYVDFVYFSPAAAAVCEEEEDKFLVDMTRSRCRDTSNGLETYPTTQERQFQVFTLVLLPVVFPVLIALTGVTTLVSKYRVHEADKARLENRSQLVQHPSHSEAVAELAYYAIADFLEGPGDVLSPLDKGLEREVDNETLQQNRCPAPASAANGVGGYQGLIESSPNKLAVTEATKWRIRVLNQLPWEKYAVKLRRMHSHAEIVNRRNMQGQGQAVLDLFTDLVEKKLQSN